MQLAIPWPNPDDLRKEERGRRLEMFVAFVAAGGK